MNVPAIPRSSPRGGGPGVSNDWCIMSPIVINVPTRGLLAVETMHAIVRWLANLNIKRNMTQETSLNGGILLHNHPVGVDKLRFRNRVLCFLASSNKTDYYAPNYAWLWLLCFFFYLSTPEKKSLPLPWKNSTMRTKLDCLRIHWEQAYDATKYQ